MEFRPMPKTPRLSREVVVTEKIDGTNASVYITPPSAYIDGLWGEPVAEHQGFYLWAGSRTRWVVPGDDNYGWAAWVKEHVDELVKLGPGHHFGEWWGRGINRAYGLTERRFSLFNVGRWKTCCSEAEGLEAAPGCCGVVPVLYRGEFETENIKQALWRLGAQGSVAAPGFMDPEGIMVYHTAANQIFKKTIKGDEAGKSFEGHVAKPPKPPRVKDASKGGRRKEQLPYEGPDRRKK